ncbi:MAG: Maf family protein [Allosphingosinicella sp.]|uniref:Maf family protein n=1 Tax=Allosphingosinicella sp. TaxID=2823234 RepID=UPI003926E27C
MTRLLLASHSPTRRRMLEAAGITFEAVSAPLDEDSAKAGLLRSGFDARDMAEMLAELKAKSVTASPAALVLGADQTLERENGVILGKPGSRAGAREQLLSLRGADHKLHSAAVLVCNGERLWGCVESVTLSVRNFSEHFLDDYLEREGEAVLGSAGAYRVEALGAQLFDRIEGSHFAILGLPLIPLLEELRRQAIVTS